MLSLTSPKVQHHPLDNPCTCNGHKDVSDHFFFLYERWLSQINKIWYIWCLCWLNRIFIMCTVLCIF